MKNRMAKRLSALLMAAVVTPALVASPLQPDEALSRATGNGPAKARAIASQPMRLRHTAMTAAGEPAAYIFTPTAGRGFVILSADDVAAPMLGYSDEGNFDVNNMPTSLNFLLQIYANQIQAAQEQGAAEYDSATMPGVDPSWTAIAPLVKTKWDQGAPYNGMTPTLNGKNCPTGCVATSLAQCMNYFQYPEIGEGLVSYKWNNKTIVMNMGKQAFDWKNMLDYYSDGDYTQAQADAVAYLMKAAGYSVNMSYGASASGALSRFLVTALTENFKYDKGVYYVGRELYSGSEWNKMVYDNIKNVGPVIYNGTSMEGGHSFIIDGYDGKGYFHVNFGWSGTSDGYYTLNVLTPGAQGTGGGVGGFNISQDALFGMQKPRAEEGEVRYANLYQNGVAYATVSGSVLRFKTVDGSPDGWCNTFDATVNVFMGAMYEKKDGSGTPTYVPGGFGGATGAISLDYGMYYSSEKITCDVSIPDLADGEYKVTLCTRDANIEGAPWQPIGVTYGVANYVYLTIKDGKKTVTNIPYNTLKITDAKCVTPLYNTKFVKVLATIVNDSEYQLTRGVNAALTLDGENQMLGESLIITVDPGETQEVEIITKFDMLADAQKPTFPQEYTLTMYDPDTNRVYGDYGVVTMDKAPTTTVKMTELRIKDLEPETFHYGGRDYSNVYVIRDSREFAIDFTYTCTRGYFENNISLGIYRKAANSSSLVPVEPGIYSEMVFMGADESKSVEVPVDMSGFDPLDLYYVRANYIKGNVSTYLGQIPFAFVFSGIDGVADDAELAAPEYYNLQGVRIAQPKAGEIVIERRGGKTVKKLWR